MGPLGPHCVPPDLMNIGSVQEKDLKSAVPVLMPDLLAAQAACLLN